MENNYEDEVFAIIEGYENYAVSNYARILIIRTQKFLKPRVNEGGYLFVRLTKDKNRTLHFLHRLLAVAFIENENEEPIIDHIDRNRQNNSISNLRWTSFWVNSANQRKIIKPNTTSQYIGVSYNKKQNKWISSIKIHGRKIHIGGFNTEVEAALAKNKYVIEHNLKDIYPLNVILD